MKKFFKILIPILLALAIIFCIGWYLFTYDRDFTRDVLLYSARYCDNHGKVTLSSWFYDRAYDLAKDNDQVAIELAQQHKADGNYTQAENTLSKAIEDGGGAELYIALCKTYIEQDKILDAVKLLGGITNQETKAALDALRPAAPVATPAPGFYNQYISVSVSGEGGTLYVNPIPEYPSVYDTPYAEPVVLQDGENTIYAVTVADNGLVSPLSIFGYTVGGVVEEVEFADAAVEVAVREALNAAEGDVIMSNQLWDIKSFVVPDGATTLADLRYMLFLEELIITNGPVGELSVLSNFSHLTTLEITNTSISTDELEFIGALHTLNRLSLTGCNIVTVNALEELTGLTYLDLSNNTIRNLQPIANMKNLQELYLRQNAVTDLNSLAALGSLRVLDVSHNSLTSLAPILGLGSLTWLDASTNGLTDLNNIDLLSSLSSLFVSGNALTDIGNLGTCTALTELDISNNALTDISALKDLTKLVTLNFSFNQVTAIPAFPVECALVTINGSNNLIESMKPLQGLRSLNNIYMDYNEKITTLEWLADNPTLILVNVYNTGVNDMTQITALTDRSIIVNFTPLQED